MGEKKCAYQDPSGVSCTEIANDSGFCFWHDPHTDKTNMELGKQLESFVRGHGVTRGLQLERANLSNVNLVTHHDRDGFDLSHSNFYRANMQGAHLFNADLSYCNLMKANLSESNLHFTKLIEANLLGAKWGNARIEHLDVGTDVVQEKEAQKHVSYGDTSSAIDFFEQAEEVYRDLRKASEQQGLFTMAGAFIQKELRMRRYQMPLYSMKRFLSKLTDMFCGYGEEPARIVLFSVSLIFIASFFYFFLGVSFDGKIFSYATVKSTEQLWVFWFNCVYYSVVTFTTLGYGDFTPVGYSRIIAALEAFIGSFTLALFVVVFVKKMTR